MPEVPTLGFPTLYEVAGVTPKQGVHPSQLTPLEVGSSYQGSPEPTCPPGQLTPVYIYIIDRENSQSSLLPSNWLFPDLPTKQRQGQL